MFSMFKKINNLIGKKIIVFFVSALVLSNSFAVDESQNALIEAYLQGKPHCIGTKKHRNQIVQSLSDGQDGLCFGLTSLWLYSKWMRVSQPEAMTAYDNRTWFGYTVTDVLGSWTNCKNIKRFFFLANKLQKLQYTQSFTKNMSLLTRGQKEFHKEYSIVALLSKEQFKHILKELVIYDHKFVYIAANQHVVGLFKDQEQYYYFDPNAKEAEEDVTSVITNFIEPKIGVKLSKEGLKEELVAKTFYENCSRKKPLVLISISIFSFEDDEPYYPSPKEILARYSPQVVDVSTSDPREQPLARASLVGCEESVHYYLDKMPYVSDDVAGAALGGAMTLGNWGIFALLLSRGIGLDATVKGEPLLVAIMHDTESGDNVKAVKILLDSGLDPNITTTTGATALMEAVGNKDPALVSLLLRHGADGNVQIKNGLTAIMVAIAYNAPDIAQLLLENGADANVQQGGISALMVAVGNNAPQIVSLLLEYGANPDLLLPGMLMSARAFAVTAGSKEIQKIFEKYPKHKHNKNAKTTKKKRTSSRKKHVVKDEL